MDENEKIKLKPHYLNKKPELQNNKNVNHYECLLKERCIAQVTGKKCYLHKMSLWYATILMLFWF